MSIAVSSATTPLDLLHEPAVAAAAYAPRESESLLALLGQARDEHSNQLAATLAVLAAIRSRLLEADVPEAADLWEDLSAASHALRGPLIDALRQAPSERQERAIGFLRELAASEAEAFVGLRGPLKDAGLVVAVAGDFKRGKSTLINAFLGRRLLPTRVAPATAVPCILKPGSELVAKVYFTDQTEPEEVPVEDLEQYACIVLPGRESDELAFRAGVQRIEISIPTTLPPNVTLIDLPGLNEEEGRTEVARQTLDSADSIIVVLAATQLLAENELQFIDNLWSRGHRSLVYAINFVDGLEEHEVRTVRERSSALLAPYGGVLGKSIFLVSARQALLARVAGEATPPESGIPELEAILRARLVDRAELTWRISRLRQVLDRLESDEEDAGRAVLQQQQIVQRMRSELGGIASRLAKAERIYAEGDAATAHDMAMRRQRIEDHAALFDGRWAALENDLRERFKREPLPWVWQKAGEWLRDELIRTIREVHPQVTPRPEGYLRISVPPGLRVGRDALRTFYLNEASREWERFTGEARRARRRELEEALAEAEREHRRQLESREATWAPLEARRAVLMTAIEAAGAGTREALQRAIGAAEALRVALEAMAD
ncbi:MAG: Dynamin family protein [Chloroflexi bacterium]|nr:Dynamin family protein [Chloroflexota bacterium]